MIMQYEPIPNNLISSMHEIMQEINKVIVKLKEEIFSYFTASFTLK